MKVLNVTSLKVVNHYSRNALIITGTVISNVIYINYRPSLKVYGVIKGGGWVHHPFLA